MCLDALGLIETERVTFNFNNFISCVNIILKCCHLQFSEYCTLYTCFNDQRLAALAQVVLFYKSSKYNNYYILHIIINSI